MKVNQILRHGKKTTGTVSHQASAILRLQIDTSCPFPVLFWHHFNLDVSTITVSKYSILLLLFPFVIIPLLFIYSDDDDWVYNESMWDETVSPS